VSVVVESPTELEILSDVIAPDSADLTRDRAEWLLTLKLPEKHQSRVAQLLEKGNRGELKPSEHVELDRFRRIGLLLNLLRAKAELSLGQPTAGS